MKSLCLQVDAYARERKLRVVGVYYASERLEDTALSPVAARIAEKVQQRCCADAALFIVRSSVFPSFRGLGPKHLTSVNKP